MSTISLASAHSPADILPQGDRFDIPPAHRQFCLRSLFYLMTMASVVAVISRWFELGVFGLLVMEFFIIQVWWLSAELRQTRDPVSTSDQSNLREEVRRWRETRKAD